MRMFSVRVFRDLYSWKLLPTEVIYLFLCFMMTFSYLKITFTSFLIQFLIPDVQFFLCLHLTKNLCCGIYFFKDLRKREISLFHCNPKISLKFFLQCTMNPFTSLSIVFLVLFNIIKNLRIYKRSYNQLLFLLDFICLMYLK